MKYDVIIIGAGLGGLECAHILSRHGAKVLVLEQGIQIGGCMQSYRRNGELIDTGFHYIGGIGEGQSLYPSFKDLNLLHLPWHRLDEYFDRITIDGHTYQIPQSFDGYVESLAAEFPEEREGLEKCARLLQVTTTNDQSLFEQQSSTSALEYLQSVIHNPLLIDILCTPSSIKGEMNRDTLPLFTILHNTCGCLESAWRLKGPGSLITDSLAEDIRKNGGEIYTRSKVTKLIITDGMVTGVECEGGKRYEGRSVISDVHPAQTVEMLDKPLGIYKRRMQSLTNTQGVFTVSLLLKKDTLRYFNWNQYLVKDGKTMLVSCRVPEDDSDYTHQVDLLTPVADGAFVRDDNYKARKEELADHCVEWAEQFVPGLHEMVEHRYTSSPLTWQRYTLAPSGSAFGVRKDYRNPMMTFLSTRTPIRNLLLTGQSLMVHGVQGVTMTAYETCKQIKNILS